MNLWKTFWKDEAGVILSAETVLLGTVGVIGATVGLSAVTQSVGDEMTDLARSLRSLDQSYHVEGVKLGSAWTAGSSFTQEPVEASLKRLDAQIEKKRDEANRREKQEEAKRDAEAREEMKAPPKKDEPKKKEDPKKQKKRKQDAD